MEKSCKILKIKGVAQNGYKSRKPLSTIIGAMKGRAGQIYRVIHFFVV